jgi:predicted dehydrogenase
MKNRKPRLGFLGVGWIGRQRLEAVAASGLAEIAAVADPVPQNVLAIAASAQGALRLESLDDLLEEDLDGIVIATPSALHAAQATAALEAGCAVFCQKPLGRSLREVQEIIAAARENDRLLGIDLSYRHTRALQKVREIVRSGELGKVFAADLIFHNAYGPDKAWFYDAHLAGGGCVMDLGVHLVDAALWILEDEVVHVFSRLLSKGRPLPILETEVEDYATAVLGFESEAVVNLACSWRLHAGCPAEILLRFFGTEGGVAMRNVGGSFTDFRAERYCGTNTEVLVEPPDDWGGGAIIAWTRRLAQHRGYDTGIEQHEKVAGVLDALYARPAPIQIAAEIPA